MRLAFNIWLVFSFKTSSLEIKNFFIREQKMGYMQEGKEPICFKCSYNPWRLLDASASELYLERLDAGVLVLSKGGIVSERRVVRL